MGALTSNRKRVDECFNLHTGSPSPSFKSPYYTCNYSNQIDTHIAKKPRFSYTESPIKLNAVLQSAVSRLGRYPEPQKLRREVHAPCRSTGFGFSSSGLRCVDSSIQKETSMGNIFGYYQKTKHTALKGLRHISVGNYKEVIDLDAEELRSEDVILKNSRQVEIVEDGNEVRSVVSDDHRALESDRLESEIQELDGKGLESGDIQGYSMVPDLVKAQNGLKGLFSVPPSLEAYKKLLNEVNRSYPRLSVLGGEIKSTEAKLESIRLMPSLKKSKEEEKPEGLNKLKEDLLREAFVPLTTEEEREVSRALSRSNRRKILVSHENSNIDITGELLQCLSPGAWLNDEVINVYLELLKEREKREPKKYLNCHFFNTFFYKKLVGGRNGYDYKAVRRWTTQRKLGYGLMDCDKIFVPIHKDVHWCLAVINKKDKSFQYLDSLGGRDLQVLKVLSRYFMDEVKDKSGQEIDVRSWDVEFVEDLPEQQNGFDCGVFMIKYADFYSKGLGLQFSQVHMPYFRLRTAKEILKLRAD
ncbi:unnamed protein product [Amaranthus hypochondriacus]